MFPFIPLGDRILLDSWRVMMTLGILGGSLVSLWVLKPEIGRARAWIIVALMALGALFGAHLAHWLLRPGLSRDSYRLLVFWKNGHSLFGALAFCSVLLLLASRIVPGLPFWTTADAFSLGVPVGLFFGRVGCYMKGCCWGTPIPPGHPFHGISVMLLHNQVIALHPVQLYSAAAAFAIFCTLLAFRRRQNTPGLLAALFLVLYSFARFFLEFFRGDTQGQTFLGVLTIYQLICVLLFLGGICLVILLRRSRRD